MSSIIEKAVQTQDEEFSFSTHNMKKIENILLQYPEDQRRSAVMPLLYLAQKQNNNWISKSAMDCIAKLLFLAPMEVYEVAHFYTMYNKQPVGEYLVQVCRTTPCWLRGSDKIAQACKEKLGIEFDQTTEDKKFTLREVECLGACVNAPVMQINDDYYEDLTTDNVVEILDNLTNNLQVSPGSQSGRMNSAPEGWDDKKS